MREADTEFDKIRAAIDAATDVLAGAIERDGGGRWDFLIVAVPQAGRPSTRVAMMSSMLPDMLPKFLSYLLVQLDAREVRKVVEINGLPQDVKPS